MGKSGLGNYLSSFPYATEMSELLDSRPIAIEESIDSSDLTEDSNDLNNTNLCVPEDPLSIFLNEKTDSNDFVYEDTPDPRDGAIPSCSKDTCEIITQNSPNNLMSDVKNDSSSTDSSSTNIRMKRKLNQKSKSRLYENIVMKYADKMKETYEKNQESIMAQTKECVSKLIESEKEMMDKMLDNHRTILKETTNQLLSGLQNIFGATARAVNTQMIPSIIPSFNETVPYLYQTGELQQFQSAANLPKVLINLKRSVGANEEIPNVKIQKLNSYSNNNSAEKVLTTKNTVTSSNVHVNEKSHS